MKVLWLAVLMLFFTAAKPAQAQMAWYCEARPSWGTHYYWWLGWNRWYAYNQALGACASVHGWCYAACRPYWL